MKREMKTELTREKIINAALHEFGLHGYEAASVNAVCERYKISKGLIYHNFHNKDEIYLVCIKRVFDELANHVACSRSAKIAGPEDRLRSYLSARTTFFQEPPLFLEIFCEAMASPPAHLKEDIERIRSDFDHVNMEVIRDLVTDLNLRLDVSNRKIVHAFCRSFDFIDAVSRIDPIYQDKAVTSEEQELNALDILLYGVIAR